MSQQSPSYHAREEMCYRLVAPFYDFSVSPRMRNVHRVAAQMLGDLPGRRVLDVGTGTGSLPLELARAGASAAVDLSPSLLGAARRKAAARDVRFMSMDACQLSFPDRGSDYACAAMVFHGMPCIARDRAVDEMSRVSRLGILLVDYRRDRPLHWSTSLLEVSEGGHCRSYRAYPIEARLRRHGMSSAGRCIAGQLEIILALRPSAVSS